MKCGWTGVEKLTPLLTYLNCQLSFGSRVPANDTPTRLDIVIIVAFVVVLADRLGRCCLDYVFSTTQLIRRVISTAQRCSICVSVTPSLSHPLRLRSPRNYKYEVINIVVWNQFLWSGC